MPSPPPLSSPTPRRWRSPEASEPHPDFAALLTGFDEGADHGPARSGSWSEGGSRHPSEQDQFLSAPESPTSSRSPEIRTTSSSPLRNVQSGLEQTPQTSGYARRVSPQSTGHTTESIDAAYDGVFSQLDALAANQAGLAQPSPTTPRPTTHHHSAVLPPPAPSSLYNNPPGLGRGAEDDPYPEISRLEVVSERTEPASSPSLSSTPTQSRAGSFLAPESAPSLTGSRGFPLRRNFASVSSGVSDFSVTSIANRFPLPPSPVKGPRTPGGPVESPKKASDLIRLFESRSAAPGESSPQPGFGAQLAPTPPTRQQPVSELQSEHTKVAQPFDTARIGQFPSSSFAPSSYRPSEQPAGSSSAFFPPPKPSSPLSQVKTMIASWRSRAEPPSQRVVGSPGSGGDTPRLFGRDRGWNVSIRRRRRDEGKDQVGLAEQAIESTGIPTDFSDMDSRHEGSVDLPIEYPQIGSVPTQGERQPLRSEVSSLRTIPSPPPRESSPKPLTGEPLRTGALYYLNVHDTTLAPDFEWVQADARLFVNGLQLIWRTPEGSQATVTLDLEYCDEVASTYSPNNPMIGDDIGGAAARRQGDLAENLYPFKLVYDDGTERLGCDSARERVRWVNAIWNVLERTRVAPAERAISAHGSRPASFISSENGGSASTHYARPAPASPGSSSHALPSPLSTSAHPRYTTDDAVIETSGGFAAPLVHRGSRHLAAGGLERTRSLRRVASEADLSDPMPLEDVEVPLTAQAARSRPVSRDFTFAGGVPPPPLQSPPPMYASPVTQTYATPLTGLSSPSAPQQSFAGSVAQLVPASTVQETSQTQSIYTPRGPSPVATSTAYTAGAASFHTARTSSPTTTAPQYTSGSSVVTAHASSPVHTAQTWSSPTVMYTPQRSTHMATAESRGTPSERTATGVPEVAVTVPSPEGSQSLLSAQEHREPSVYSLAHGSPSSQDRLSTLATAHRPISTYTTASSGLGSPFMTPADRSASRLSTARESVSSYQSAPPPVPSRDSKYETASSGRSSDPGSPVKYQLYDPPMSHYAATAPSDEDKLRPSSTSTRLATAHSTLWTEYESAPYTQSHYSSAPPPPVSRSTSPGQRLSPQTTAQDRAETASVISEPESDHGLIAELDRQTSDGSNRSGMYQSAKSPATPRRTTATSTGRTPLGTAIENTLYDTARESTYVTAPTWHTRSTQYTTARGTQESYLTPRSSLPDPIRGVPPGKPESISTAQSVGSASRFSISRVPVPSAPSPSLPPSTSALPTISSSSTSASSSTAPFTASYDVNRILNYLQGQDTARQNQTTRMATQLDRIEGKVTDIAGSLSERPPPLPPKGGSPPSSPTSSSSSTSSLDTAMPTTPRMDPLQSSLAERLDDLQSLMGMLLGRTEDLAQAIAKPRHFDVEYTPRDPGVQRVENLLRRALSRLGETELEDEPFQPGPYEESMSHPQRTPSDLKSTRDGSYFEGSETMYSEELNPRRRAPVNSFTSLNDRAKKRFSIVSESLLEGDLPEGDFDEEFAMQDLPPPSPIDEHVLPRVQVPPHLLRRGPPKAQPPSTPVEEHHADDDQRSFYTEDQQPTEYESQREAALEPEREVVPDPSEAQRDQRPIPYRTEARSPSEQSGYYEDGRPERGPSRPPPPPQPVDLPTPVRSPGAYPPQSYPGGRPPMQPMSMGGFPPPPPPGFQDVPRPSLPRIAGVRDPISTTYFRRGFPPLGPMGMPMGMFPGPMGIPGPGMGPFMPGLRPGLNGFGGALGPNVAPHLRRPGMAPPGVYSTTGDYGLPAGARYGNASGPTIPGQPGRSGTLAPDYGRGNTTSESSTTPTTATEQLVTPPQHHADIPPVSHAESDDSFQRALHNAQTLAEAQGDQQNEMSRYLHGMSDQIADARNANGQELASILADLARLREELKPKHVTGHVLPDGRVVLSNGDIVDGIRGVPPTAGAPAVPPPPPSAIHVPGTILPDGTVMADGRVVDGIRAAPPPAAAGVPETVDPLTLKDMEQDRKLASLMDKVSGLMHRGHAGSDHGHDPELSVKDIGPTPLGRNTDVTREKTTIKEREVIRDGLGGHHKEHETEEEREIDTVAQPQAAGSVDSGGATRINPRTGKPLVMPKSLSLTPHPMSPIQTETGGDRLIREEHEEIIQRPGGPSVQTTTRTYRRPDGSIVTITGAPENVNADVGPQQPAHTLGNVPPSRGVPSQGPLSVLGDAPTTPQFHPEALDAVPPSGSVHHAPDGGLAPPISKGSKGAKAPKEVWDTNRPRERPETTARNVPVSPSAHDGHPVPPKELLVEADTGASEPAGTGAGGPGTQGVPGVAGPGAGGAGDAGFGGDSGQTLEADPGGAAPAGTRPPASSSGGRKGVHWTTRLPQKELPDAPAKQPKSTELANIPTAPAQTSQGPAPEGAGDSADPQDVTEGDPSGGPPHHADNTFETNPARDRPASGQHDLLGAVPGVGPPQTAGAPPPDSKAGDAGRTPGLLSRVRPPKLKGTSSQGGQGEGPVPPSKTEVEGDAADQPLSGPDGINSHDMAGAPLQPGPFADRNSEVPGMTGDPQAAEQAPTVVPGKLKKSKPGADAGLAPGGSANQVVPGPRPPGSGGPAPSMKSQPPADLPILEEVTLPDGTKAYVRHGTAPAMPSEPGSKRGRGAESINADVAATRGLAESNLGGGHCSVCCPSAPRDAGGNPIFPCAHQAGVPGAAAAGPSAVSPIPATPRSGKGKSKDKGQGEGQEQAQDMLIPAGPLDLPGEEMLVQEHDAEAVVKEKGPPNKLKKGGAGGSKGLSPEEEALEDARKLAVKQKAAAEIAADEKAERDRILADKEAKRKLLEDRHLANIDALLNLQRAVDALAADQKAWRSTSDERVKAQDKRRTDKSSRDKKFQDSLDVLVKEREEAKKRRTADDKKPGTQAILDALKAMGDGQAQFIRKFGTDIMQHNTDQHSSTQAALKAAAREQVGFNLAGYLDDFSKALSGEVRVLLKEVGDLRESRRALYMELAELLLMKGRQSHGDLMAVLPYPTAPPKNPAKAENKPDPPKPAPGGGQGGAPGGFPAWSTYAPPQIPVIGGPARPLPQPQPQPQPQAIAAPAAPAPTSAPQQLTNLGGRVMPPPPPPTGTRPLPQV